MNEEVISLDEIIHVQLALKAIIIYCDKQIADCKSHGLTGNVWIDKKSYLNSALIKLESKNNRGEL
jgi:hypothetical protein